MCDLEPHLRVTEDRMLRATEETLDDDVAYAAARGLRGVACHAAEVPRLRDYPFEALRVLDTVYFPKRRLDLSNVSSMKGLRSLALLCEGLRADLRPLEALEELQVVVGRHVTLPARARSLRSLTLRKYSGDLASVPDAPELRELWIGAGNFADLAGVERFGALEYVRLALLPRLTRVRPLTALRRLRRLVVEASANVVDLDALGQLDALEELELHVRSVPDLAFLDRMRSLRKVNLGKTDVLDGDLTPLLSVPDVNFVNRRHFSHRRDEETVTDPQGRTSLRIGPMVARG